MYIYTELNPSYIHIHAELNPAYIYTYRVKYMSHAHTHTHLILNRSWANKKKRKLVCLSRGNRPPSDPRVPANRTFREGEQTDRSWSKEKKWRIRSQFPDWPVQRILVSESPKVRRCITQFPRMRQIQESREDRTEWAQAVQYIASQEQGPRAMSRERHNRTVLKK